ncbi:MAG TPA: MFS transporter [Anaerolineae bacterium]|nr:MFS transporter [Anaerolineae bacterium]HIP73002.1 MFS transporter [Anaerolineae bacterium]
MTVTAVPNTIRRRITGTLFTSQSLFSAAIIASFTLTPIIAADLSGSDSTAGIPSTLTLLGRAAAAYPLGWLMDKAGRRLGLSVGYMLALLGAVTAVFAILSGSFSGFLVGATLVGMGRAPIDQSRYVAAEVYPQKRQAKVIGLIVFAGTIGAIVGPLLVVPSTKLMIYWESAANAGPFVVAALLYLLALSAVFLFLRPDPKLIGAATEAEETHTDVLAAPARPLRQIFRQPSVILATSSLIIGQLVMTMVMIITPLYMNRNDHSDQAISMVIMAHTLGMFGLSGVTGWLIDRYGRIPLIIAGSLVLAASALIVPLSTNVFVLALALFLLGLGWNFSFVAGSSLLSNSLSANERGRAQGTSDMMVALASGLAGLLAGVIFNWGSILAVAAVSLAFSLSLLGVLFWFRLSRRPAQAPAA